MQNFSRTVGNYINFTGLESSRRHGSGRASLLPVALIVLILACLLCGTKLFAAPPLQQDFGPSQIEKQIEAMPSPQGPPQAAQLPDATATRIAVAKQSFVLTGVLVEGATAFRTTDFLPLYQPYLGSKITIDELRKIADSFTRHYHEAGYFLSHAFIPAQSIEFGVVRIRMVEGYISNWRMLGDGNSRDPQIDEILQPLLTQRPLQRDTLNSAFQNLAALPDLSLHPYVQPLEKPLGAYTLVLRADHKHFDGGVSIDNHGSNYIGPVQGILTLRALDLTGHHETYQLKLATVADSDELHYADVATEWPLGTNGLRLQADAALTSANPGGYLKPLEAHIESSRIRFGISYPLQRSVNQATYLGATFYSYRSRTNLSGVKRLEDKLSSVVVSFRHIYQADEAATHVMGLSIAQGLIIAGSKVLDTQNTTDGGQPDFTKLNINYAYLRIFDRRWTLSTRLDGQYAVNAMPGLERYSIGGVQFGRAYDPSEISGDHGLAGRLELAYRMLHKASHWHISPFGFYDIGAVWEVHPQTRPYSASLASLGLGVRMAAEAFSAYIEAGKPLTRAVASQDSDGKKTRVFAGVVYKF